MRHFALAIALGLVASGAASAQDVGDIEAGHQLASGICAECHIIESIPGPAPDLDPLPFEATEALPFDDIANTPGVTAMVLFVWLTSSHPSMPDLVLEEDELRNVVAYILSLKDQEPIVP